MTGSGHLHRATSGIEKHIVWTLLDGRSVLLHFSQMSPEVAAAVGRSAQGEGVDAFGHDVDDPVGVLEPPSDEEARSGLDDPAVARPAAPGAHDVDHASLVLEVEEGDAAGG